MEEIMCTSSTAKAAATIDIEAAAREFFEYSQQYRQKLQSKTALLNHKRIKRLEHELVESKQNVVKNIKRYRELERNIVHNVLTSQALHERMEDSLNSGAAATGGSNAAAAVARYREYKHILHAANSGEKVRFTLSASSIILLEATCRINYEYPGLGKVMYDSYLRYNDEALVAKLNSFPTPTAPISAELFARMAAAASKQKISQHDAMQIFHRAQHLINSSNDQCFAGEEQLTDQSRSQQQWDSLLRLLRKELFTVHMILSVLSSAEYSAALRPAAFTTTTGFLMLPTPQQRSKSSTINSSRGRIRLTATAAGSGSESMLLSPGRLRPRDVPLTSSLQRSKEKQSSYQQQIAKSISSLYDNDILSVDQIRGHKKALNLFRSLAVQKLEVVLTKVVKRFMCAKLLQWKRAIEGKRIREMSTRFLKLAATLRMLQLLEIRSVRSCTSALLQLQRSAMVQRYKEETRYSIQLQRYWRGSLTRMRITRERRRLAAVNVQLMVRMVLAKTKTKHMRQFAHRKKAARKLQKLFRARRWNRVMRRVLRQLYLDRNATRIQKRVRGMIGRRRFARILLQWRRFTGALKMQCLFRKHAARGKRRSLLLARQRRLAATCIQRHMRGIIGRCKYRIVKRRHDCAVCIQCCWRRHRAVLLVQQRRQQRAAINIQRVARGRMARKRIRQLRKEKRRRERREYEARQTIGALLLGVLTRRRIAPAMAAHKQRRNAQSRRLQQLLQTLHIGHKARQRVKQLRLDAVERQRAGVAAAVIQRRVRGLLGRKRAAERLRQVERERERALKGPYYYRLKDEYYRTQNTYHRPFVLRIQCAIRCRLARNRAYHLFTVKHLRVIQQIVRSFLSIRRAKREVRMKQLHIIYRTSCARKIQRLARIYLNNAEKMKHRHADLLKKFLRDAVIPSKLQRAIRNFRQRKQKKQFLSVQSVKIQSVVRRRQAQKYVRRSRKRLMRQRNVRIQERRNTAAMRIQGFFYIIEAKRAVARRKEQLAELERERREYELIELSLEGMHAAWMRELLAIRAQTGVRAMLARNEFIERVRQHKFEMEQAGKREKQAAAVVIQAFARGAKSRRWFKKALPQLRKTLRMRSYCVECESRIALRRCRQCRDKYCIDCYQRLHMKGNRRNHSWEHITQDVRALNNAIAPGGKSGHSAGTGMETDLFGTKRDKKSDRSEWEEFYDSSAQAKYWFNKVSGEASWISPWADR